MLDQQFRSERGRLVRELADKADPWTKSRLLKLAGRYECDDRPLRPTRLNLPTELQLIGRHSTGSER
jgi:hypothetical protein